MMRKARVYLQIADGHSPGTGWTYTAHVVNATTKRPANPKPGAIVIPIEVEIPAEYFGYLAEPLGITVPTPQQVQISQVQQDMQAEIDRQQRLREASA